MFFAQSGKPTIERVGKFSTPGRAADLDEMETILGEYPAVGPTYTVLVPIANGGVRIDHFMVIGQDPGEPADGGYSVGIGEGGSLTLTDQDGHLVVAYGPRGWLELRPSSP